MSKLIEQLERLILITSPAQVAVWLRYKDPRMILRWIERGSIPKYKLVNVEHMLKERGVKNERIIRRANGKKEAAN